MGWNFSPPNFWGWKFPPKISTSCHHPVLIGGCWGGVLMCFFWWDWMVKWRANHIFPKSSKDWAKIHIFKKQHLEGVLALKSTRRCFAIRMAVIFNLSMSSMNCCKPQIKDKPPNRVFWKTRGVRFPFDSSLSASLMAGKGRPKYHTSKPRTIRVFRGPNSLS